MILKDKKKWVMMFVSQIYMVLAMTLIITGLEGFNGYYQKQYNQAINNNLVMIQKKNQAKQKFGCDNSGNLIQIAQSLV